MWLTASSSAGGRWRFRCHRSCLTAPWTVDGCVSILPLLGSALSETQACAGVWGGGFPAPSSTELLTRSVAELLSVMGPLIQASEFRSHTHEGSPAVDW